MFGDTSSESVCRANYKVGWLAVLLTVLVFHVVTVFRLESYYATHLPHYDAMGSYTRMFEIIQLYQTTGWNAAFQSAINYDLSWLQGLFACVAAPLLDPTPSSIQVYNSLCLLVAAGTLFMAARTMGLSALRSYCATLILLVPDVFYEVQGGLSDLQRDPSYVLLLSASFYSWLAWRWDTIWWRGALFGLLCGLTTLSRGNAFPFQVVMFAPLIAWSAWVALRKRILVQSLSELLPAVLVYALVAGPFLQLRFISQIERYQNPYVAYALGSSALDSVAAHWTKPVELVAGHFRKADSFQIQGFRVSVWAMAGGVAGLALLFAGGIVRLTDRRLLTCSLNREVLVSACWVLVSCLGLIFFVAKVRALSFPETKYPFYPVLVAFFSSSLLFVQLPMPGRRVVFVPRTAGLVLVLLVLLAVGGAAFKRMRVKTPVGDSSEIATVQALAAQLQRADGRRPLVAFLWLEGFSLDSINFYNAQAGRQYPFKLLYQFDQRWQDFAVTAPDGVDPADMMLAAEHAIIETADFVVLNRNLDVYRIRQARNPLFQAGSSMVERLLSESRFTNIFSFTFRRAEFTLLRRR